MLHSLFTHATVLPLSRKFKGSHPSMGLHVVVSLLLIHAGPSRGRAVVEALLGGKTLSRQQRSKKKDRDLTMTSPLQGEICNLVLHALPGQSAVVSKRGVSSCWASYPNLVPRTIALTIQLQHGRHAAGNQRIATRLTPYQGLSSVSP